MKQPKTIPLGNLVQLIMGQAPPSKECNFEGHGTPFVKVGEFGDRRPRIREWTMTPLRVACERDVLLCVVGATCGKLNLGIDCAIGRSVAAIRPDSTSLDQFYLYYFLQTLVLRLRAGASGAAQTVISKRMLHDVPIPYVPLSEQKRIVAILDEAFAAIETATANAEKNLANARELFESHLNSVFEKKGEGWEEKKLGEVCENLDSQRIPITKSKRKPGPIPYYGASGVVDHVADFLFDEGLLLVSEDGANLLARSYPIAFSVTGKSWVNNHAHVLRFASRAYQAVVEFYLNSISLTPYVSGMAQPKLNQKSLNSIPVPWTDDQSKITTIVQSITSVQGDTQRLEFIYQKKLDALAELKQSILQKAFAGELCQ